MEAQKQTELKPALLSQRPELSAHFVSGLTTGTRVHRSVSWARTLGGGTEHTLEWGDEGKRESGSLTSGGDTNLKTHSQV